VNTVPEVDKCI